MMKRAIVTRTGELATGLLVLVLLTGCMNVSQHRASLEEAGERIEDMRETLAEPAAAAPEGARQIEVPREQAWLYRHADPVDYHMPLRATVEELFPGRPVIYRMAPGYDPMVRSMSGARTLKEHLDSIALQANVSWSYSAGTLVFSAMVSRQYRLPMFGGTTNTTGLQADNLNTESDISAGVTNSFEATTSLMTELEVLVNTTLGILPCQKELDDLGQQQQLQLQEHDLSERTLAGVPHLRTPQHEQECYSVSGLANLLTITARPQTLLRFEEAYRPFAEGLKRSALLKIITIKLDVTDLTQQRLDVDLVRQGSKIVGGGEGGLLLSNISSDLTSSQATDGGAVFRATFNDPDSRWSGSSVLLQSLESIANITVEDSRELLAYSNRLVTIQDTERFKYVSSLERQREFSNDISTVSTTIETDEVVTGQALNILPSLTDDTISMHIVINEANLTRLKVEGDATIRITLPDTSNSDVVFDVSLGDRETALIASTIRAETELREDKSGILPIGWLNRILSNSNEGQQRIYQTVYLIEARFQTPVPLS